MKNCVIILGLFALLLNGCGSGSNLNGDLSHDASKKSENDSVDSSGCHSIGTPFGGGKGTESDPYLICTAQQLQNMAESLNQNYFALTSDIDLSKFKHSYLGIGITGVFDGRNHVIKNFSINAYMGQQNGYLFGQLYTFGEFVAEIKNLRLENFRIEGKDLRLAATLIGTNMSGIITNVHVTGTIIGTEGVGGIVAHNLGIVRDSSFSGSVIGTKEVGGIAGWANDFSIENCRVKGEISGSSLVGGIVGKTNEKFKLVGKNELSEARVIVGGVNMPGLAIGQRSDRF